MKLGLQLFSVRDEMAQDMEGTLKKVAEMGYECVEFAGYFGHTAEEVKAMCEKYNLEPVSVHQKYDVFIDNPEESVEYIKALGVKYCVVPWTAPEQLQDEYDKIVADLKNVSKLLKDNGIKLGYHNHDFELLIKREGESVLDTLIRDVSPELIQPELDLCWVHYSGSDPCEYIKKYGDIEEIIHIKDFDCKNLAAGPVYALIDDKGKANDAVRKDRESDGFEFRPVGQGRQNVQALLDAMKGTKIEYIIVEQDSHANGKPLENVAESAKYLRSLGV